MSKSTGIRVYISRDARPFSNVELWTRKPTWDACAAGEGVYTDNNAGPLETVRPAAFKRMIGVKLKCGQIRHVRISVEDV